MTDPTTALDPITYEVVRNRLIAITEEMRVALQAVSGSPTVTEASDFFTGLFRPGGSFVSMGFQVTFAAPAVGTLIEHILEAGKVPVRPGDMFIANDPYIGALHQNDVQMTSPIFVGDRLIGWAGVMAHETDVGGMDFASWSPKAREVYQEGLRIPAVKLVDGGELREDVLEMIVTASRLPEVLELDLRAFVATLNVAQNRVVDLVGRYGADAIEDVMGRMIDVSEARLRQRLLQLPDGEVNTVDYIEHDGHENKLYRIALRLRKQADTLALDFGGSSPQAPGFINATRVGLHAGVAGALLPTLGFDIPWNAGLLRPVTIDAPDGLICTAQHPAPVGSATVEAIWSVSNATAAALNRLLACTPGYRGRAQAISSGTMATFNLGGVNQYGERFGLHLMDPLAGGQGAFTVKDGVDAGGPINAPMPSIADVERNEQLAPLHYLYRRIARDTAGAGRSRGGSSAEIAVSLGGVRSAEALIMTHGLEVPNSMGLFGGLPGAPVRQRLGWGALGDGGSHAPVAQDASELGGRWEELGPKPGLFEMTDRDVFAVSWHGGGGIGDPLDREVAAVVGDVVAGHVSVQAAAEVYGVVVADGEAGLAATEQLRTDIRRRRIEGAAPSRALPAPEVARVLLVDGLSLVATQDGDWHVVSDAGAVLATNSTAWRRGAVAGPLVVCWPAAVLHEGLQMTAFYCPGSGRLLAADLQEAGAAPLDDLILDDPAVRQLLAAATQHQEA
jgi:N-methylhydantoinase B